MADAGDQVDAPVQGYSGYLSPLIDRILAMHQDGADTRTIAEALYRAGVRADTTSPYVLRCGARITSPICA